MFILFVSDPQASRDFYASVFACEPILDVPGMTEFNLAGYCLDADGYVIGFAAPIGSDR
jgi:catechol 2,3-dioxygenase-like lactoylglutathione lyase family enzyme